MPFQELPQELVERVLDEFRPLPRSKKTRKALLACALVNKSFSAYAQRLLISDIRLELEHSERIACLHSVLSSTPSLVRYVRSISIIFNRENLQRSAASWFRLASIEPVLKLLQEHKAEPERMSIKNEGPSYYPYHRRFMFYSLDPLFRDAIQQFYAPNLTTLHLSAVELQEGFIAHWPKTLQKLVLNYCTVANNYANSDSTAVQTFPKLEYLCLGNIDGPLWKIFWVQHSTSSRNQIASKLKKVRFVYDSVSDLSVIWSLLTVRNLGSVLEDLELVQNINKWNGPLTAPTDLKYFNLGRFESLRYLTIKCVMTSTEWILNLKTALILLDSLTLTRIEVINISLAGHPGDWRAGSFAKFIKTQAALTSLDKCLSQTNLHPALQALNIFFYIQSSRLTIVSFKDANRYLHHQIYFPLLKKRGIIPKIVITVDKV